MKASLYEVRSMLSRSSFVATFIDDTQGSAIIDVGNLSDIAKPVLKGYSENMHMNGGKLYYPELLAIE